VHQHTPKKERVGKEASKPKKETEAYIGHIDASFTSLSLLFVFPMELSLQ